jgi:hypothetical protein
MEKDDLNKDDFLGRLIQQSPIDCPSEDFVERVMANIHIAPEKAPSRNPFLGYLNTAAPYILLVLVFIVVFSTSDLPFLNWMPGKTYYLSNLVPCFATLFAGFKDVFATKYVSFGLLIVASASLLFVIDLLFSRKSSV